MVGAGVIVVHVMDDLGQPRAEVEVRVLQVTHAKDRPNLSPVRIRGGDLVSSLINGYRFTTDDRGIARIYGLRPADYAILAMPNAGVLSDPLPADRERVLPPVYFPGVLSPTAAQWMTLGPGEEIHATIRLATRRSAHVQGRVSQSDGAPSRSIVVLSWKNGDAALTMEPLDGTFTFWGVSPGEYTVCAIDLGDPAGETDVCVDILVDGDDVTDLSLTTSPVSRSDESDTRADFTTRTGATSTGR